MKLNAWWHAPAANPRLVQLTLEALKQAGVTAIPWSDPQPAAMGLLFIGREIDEAVTALKDLSRSSDGRIMVVHTGPDPECGLETSKAFVDAGASDIIDLPTSGVASVVARLKRWQAIDMLMVSDQVRHNLVGSGTVWIQFLRGLIEASRFSQAPVLLTGETGTGKELAAQLVHMLDPLASKRKMVVVDCTTIVPELAGSELFGHERGSFTGSTGTREGAFALANGGTLFLDEIGELPLQLQSQLLRAVQEMSYKQVGGNTWRRSEFRLVCATNRDLLAEVEQGRFRRDLYYRIAGVTCRTPPLRDRLDDVLTLTSHFLEEFLKTDKAPALSAAVRAYLVSREYPGNVRDLRQLVQQMARRYLGCGPMTVATIPETERRTLSAAGHWQGTQFEECVAQALACGVGLKDIGKAAEDTAVRIALSRSASVKEAAARLSVTQRAVQKRRSVKRDDLSHQNGHAQNGSVGHGEPGNQS